MRLFVAVELSPKLRASLEREVEKLMALAPDARWVPASNLHLTLVFLGHLDEAQVPAITAALDAVAARHAPLSLEVGGGGTFGTKKRPRVLWTDVRGETERLGALHADLESALEFVGYEPEARAYQPHVTLARARDPRGEAALAACAEALQALPFAPLRTKEIVLMKSTTKPTGAVYEPLHRAKLGA